MTAFEILALGAMGLFALGFFSFLGYTLWAVLGSSPRRPRSLPERIAAHGKLLIDPNQHDAPNLVLTNDRTQFDLAEVARSIGFQAGSPTEPRLMSAVEQLVHQAFRRTSGGGSGRSSTTHSATAATPYDLVSCALGAGVVSICNLEWTETIDTDGRPPRIFNRGQTIVLYETPPEVQLPTFALQKRSQELSRVLPLLRWLHWGAFQEARVPNDPEFTSRVYVSTKTPQLVLPLLTPELRRVMLGYPDILVNANGRFLVVTCRHCLIPCLAWEQSAFLRTAQTLIGSIAGT